MHWNKTQSLPIPYMLNPTAARPGRFSIRASLLLDQYKQRTFAALELIAVYMLTLTILYVLGRFSVISCGWLLSPGILIAAAILPTWLRGQNQKSIGLNLRHLPRSLTLLAIASLTCFPLTLLALYLLRMTGLTLPAALTLSPAWILYQLLYIAPAEELFFRGYVINRLLSLKSSLSPKSSIRYWHGCVILLSAALFALAHILIIGDLLSAFTFLPGLVMAWLFLKTRSLLAPIIFHALANIFFAFALHFILL